MANVVSLRRSDLANRLEAGSARSSERVEACHARIDDESGEGSRTFIETGGTDRRTLELAGSVEALSADGIPQC